MAAVNRRREVRIRTRPRDAPAGNGPQDCHVVRHRNRPRRNLRRQRDSPRSFLRVPTGDVVPSSNRQRFASAIADAAPLKRERSDGATAPTQKQSASVSFASTQLASGDSKAKSRRTTSLRSSSRRRERLSTWPRCARSSVSRAVIRSSPSRLAYSAGLSSAHHSTSKGSSVVCTAATPPITTIAPPIQAHARLVSPEPFLGSSSDDPAWLPAVLRRRRDRSASLRSRRVGAMFLISCRSCRRRDLLGYTGVGALVHHHRGWEVHFACRICGGPAIAAIASPPRRRRSPAQP
jgi:hypothetical protein